MIPVPPAPPGPLNHNPALAAGPNWTIANGQYVRVENIEAYGGPINTTYNSFTNNGSLFNHTESPVGTANLVPSIRAATISNSGTVVYTSDGGISSSIKIFITGHQFTNSGQIFAIASGSTFAKVVDLSGPDAVLENTGLMASFSANAGSVAVSSYSSGTINNRAGGTILSEGKNAIGVAMAGISWGGAALNNWGRIEAASTEGGALAIGVDMYMGTVTNRGTIAGDIGVTLLGTLDNHGVISGPVAVYVYEFGYVNNHVGGRIEGDVVGGTRDLNLVNEGLIVGNVRGGTTQDVISNVGAGAVDGNVYLGLGNDRFTGAGARDRVTGDAGNDTVDGAAGDDLLLGGAGNDILLGGAGNDGLFGESGNDRIVTSGADIVDGGAGNDRIELGDYAFRSIAGGGGNDTLVLAAGSRSIDVSAIVASGRVSGIETIEMQAGQSLALRVGDVKTLTDTGQRLRIDGVAGNQVMLVGAWQAAGEIVDGGVRYLVYQSEGRFVEVLAAITAQANVADPNFGGLDAIGAGAVAWVPGTASGLDFSQSEFFFDNFEVIETLEVPEEHLWYNIGFNPVMTGRFDSSNVNVYGTVLAVNEEVKTAIAIEFDGFGRVENYGRIAAFVTGTQDYPLIAGYYPLQPYGAYGVREAFALRNEGVIEVESAVSWAVGAGRMLIEFFDYDRNGDLSQIDFFPHQPINQFDNKGLISATAMGSNAVAIGAVTYDARNDGDIEAAGGRLAIGLHSSLQVVNSGSIVAVGNGPAIGVVFSGGSQAYILENSGTIVGDYALLIQVEHVNPRGVTVRNSGLMIGTVATSTVADLVINTGRIEGAVMLGGAADTYDGRGGGIVTGGVFGGARDDRYFVDDQSTLIFEKPNEGTDIVTSGGNYYLYANVENLTLAAGAGNIFGVGNELANTILGNEGENLLIAGAGADIVRGGAARDAIFGEDGDDQLFGDAGIDYIVGGTGKDVIDGGADADEIYGQDGDDTLIGGVGFHTDILVGGLGNDILRGDSTLGDYDLLYGNEGDDRFYVDTPDDLVFEQAGQGTDTVYANINGAGYYLYANIENLVLEGNTPFGVGNALDNRMTGNAAGNYLLGGAGNDTLDGRGGNDVLFGEAGNDVFVFTAGGGSDVIGDFTRGQDRIDLSALGITSLAQISGGFVQDGNVGAIRLASGDLIVLHNVQMSALTAGDFIFASSPAKMDAFADMAMLAQDAFDGGSDVPLFGDQGAEIWLNLYAREAVLFG
ncbi:hypothetical protein ATE62_19685 [Sphingopyxis sp. HIX]|nr:hypothetical protein ATE62_19685 [Sphingopyxis sp. HIX]KTE82337.1 hypothetical protein ATE72_16105 [Sphingopyxis sp. HXXIV]